MRLPRRVYAIYLWVLAGARTISLRPPRPYLKPALDQATDRLIADLKRQAHADLTTTAAADCPRDGRTPNTPQKGQES